MPQHKRGFIDSVPRETDYLAGYGNAVHSGTELKKGDYWKNYISQPERQSNRLFDTYSCVPFSYNNYLEIVLNYDIAHGMITQENHKWLADNQYLDDDGRVNFSERDLAQRVGITNGVGTTFEKCAEVARHKETGGLIPDRLWAFDEGIKSFDQYMKKPSPDLEEHFAVMRQEFRQRFTTKYEWIIDDDRMHNLPKIRAALRFSPLQVSLYAWSNPVDGIYPATIMQRNHATVLLDDFGDYTLDYDTYDGAAAGTDFLKKLAPNYALGTYAMRHYILHDLPLNEETMPQFYKVTGKPAVYILGADMLYHPIAQEDYILKLYGSWDKVQITDLKGIDQNKVGEMVGTYSSFMKFIYSLLKI